MRGVTMK